MIHRSRSCEVRCERLGSLSLLLGIVPASITCLPPLLLSSSSLPLFWWWLFRFWSTYTHTPVATPDSWVEVCGEREAREGRGGEGRGGEGRGGEGRGVTYVFSFLFFCSQVNPFMQVLNPITLSISCWRNKMIRDFIIVREECRNKDIKKDSMKFGPYWTVDHRSFFLVTYNFMWVIWF